MILILRCQSFHGHQTKLYGWGSDISYQRILSRPWRADKFLSNVLDRMASGRGSPAQIIQHSEDLRSAFRLLLDTRERNLRAAKHRFESYQRPLGRTVRFFPIMIKLMSRVWNERRDARARDWLAFIAETPQHALQLAMLADAADEGMALTRFCDKEDLDIAALSGRIASFMDRVVHLFGEKRGCLTAPGYTQLMLKTLQHPIVWGVGDRSQSTRPPSPRDINACLGRMLAWLHLAKATIDAEFPDWELGQPFRIFDVSTNLGNTSSTVPQEHVSRLARVFNVDPTQLAA